MKAIIIANGTSLKKESLTAFLSECDYIVCADGGLNNLVGTKYIPNAILGDFDSVKENVLDEYKKLCEDIVKFKKDKDKTDTELAIDFVVNKGYKDIILLCVTGSRLDHTMANIMLLEKYYNLGINIKIVDNNNEIIFLKNNMKLKRKDNFFISIIPLTGVVEGINLKGFKFKLIDKTINRGSTLCISNYIVDDYGEITIRKGNALVFISKD